MEVRNIEESLSKIGGCLSCGSSLVITEESSQRAGLATQLRFCCSNRECTIQPSEFHTTKKTGKTYDINLKLTLGGRLTGKGRAGLETITSVVGLNSPLSRHAFAEKTKILQSAALSLLDENLREAGKRTREAASENSGDTDISDESIQIIDIPCMVDGAWGTRGWDAKQGVATAIAENTGQVVDIAHKNTWCRQCNTWKEKRDCLLYTSPSPRDS